MKITKGIASALAVAALAVGVMACSSTSPAATATANTLGSGNVYAGTQTCNLQTLDGSELVNVTVIDTANCQQWVSGLSADGKTWTLTGSPFPSYLDTCYLRGGRTGMTMVVASGPSGEPDQPTQNIAPGVCQGEETAGWYPATSGLYPVSTNG